MFVSLSFRTQDSTPPGPIFKSSGAPQQEESQPRKGRRWKYLVKSYPKTCRLVLEPHSLGSNRPLKTGEGVYYLVSYTVCRPPALFPGHLMHFSSRFKASPALSCCGCSAAFLIYSSSLCFFSGLVRRESVWLTRTGACRRGRLEHLHDHAVDDGARGEREGHREEGREGIRDMGAATEAFLNTYATSSWNAHHTLLCRTGAPCVLTRIESRHTRSLPFFFCCVIFPVFCCRRPRNAQERTRW